jgi:hypothetical protein
MQRRQRLLRNGLERNRPDLFVARSLEQGFRGATLFSAKQLLDAVRADPAGKRCRHILNCNMLRRGAPLAKLAPPPIAS